ncbi:hypothetical protein C8046_08535 [Serinibacter arcticus]|uniref:Uncharacterized protein n=1 Tax=Serinibacter arcticus TaxID=1655435 RepID=A0A2U1ZUU1_9MICO|nr:hypothetical protein [Serinibacter arcticus]PWD50692.1 hypothetical protein C8046_08535 [Serinibacter arcticus]
MDGYTVRTETLSAAADTWDEQAQVTSSASSLVTSATTGGFRPDALASVEIFVRTWSDVLQTMSRSAQSVSSGLSESAAAYAGTDEGVVEWLGSYA